MSDKFGPQYHRLYREENKEVLRERRHEPIVKKRVGYYRSFYYGRPIKCSCGRVIRFGQKYSHMKTEYHRRRSFNNNDWVFVPIETMELDPEKMEIG